MCGFRDSLLEVIDMLLKEPEKHLDIVDTCYFCSHVCLGSYLFAVDLMLDFEQSISPLCSTSVSELL